MGEVINLNEVTFKITDDLIGKCYPFKDFHAHQLITSEKLSKQLPPVFIEPSLVYTYDKWFHPLVIDKDLRVLVWDKFYHRVPSYNKIFNSNYEIFEKTIYVLYTRTFDWPKYQSICTNDKNWIVIDKISDEEGVTIIASLYGLPKDLVPHRVYRYNKADTRYEGGEIGRQLEQQDLLFFVETKYLDKITSGGII